MNIYRVYSDPRGSDQRMVIAPDAAVAIAATDLADRSFAKAYYVREATAADMDRPSFVRADVRGYSADHN